MPIIILYLSFVIESIVGFIGIYKYRKLSTELRYLEWYILFCTLMECTESFLAHHHQHNLWLLHINDPIELILLALILYGWRTNRKFGIYLWYSFAVYLVVYIVGLFSFEPLNEATTYTSDLSQAIQIMFGAWLLITVLTDDKRKWKDDARFWTVGCIVLYAAATFVLFGSFNIMLKTLPAQVMINLWVINLIFIIISHLFFLRAFSVNRK